MLPMGVIVAAPTAGSAGVVPGATLAVADHLHAEPKKFTMRSSVLQLSANSSPPMLAWQEQKADVKPK